MKYEVEQKFKEYENFKIFRLSYVWSFKNSFSRYLIDTYNNEGSIEIFDPFVRSIVDIEDVTLFLVKCCEDPKSIRKITNICGQDKISRLDLIKSISKYIKIEYNIAEDDKDFFLYRPKNILMESLYLEDTIEKKVNNIYEILFKIKDYV
jgi:dTDP-4-dehydrorhamnose reductase